jgi:hypothetical protein
VLVPPNEDADDQGHCREQSQDRLARAATEYPDCGFRVDPCLLSSRLTL